MEASNTVLSKEDNNNELNKSAVKIKKSAEKIKTAEEKDPGDNLIAKIQ